MSMVQANARIQPFFWFESKAEEAVNFYVSTFPNSRIVKEFRSPVDTVSGPAGSILTLEFALEGLKCGALNGGPHHAFTDAISFVVPCETQDEIDHLWSRLSEGGQEIACGWLRDRFGVAWQIVPRRLTEYVQHPAAMKAMMGMVKLDIAALELAAKG
jgi:predicted 3-demethylubiquinone-9 3-methyltransferase (glyoxalase superfamily)